MWRHLYNADADLGIDDGITDTLSWLEDINQSPTKHTIRNLYSKFEIAIQVNNCLNKLTRNKFDFPVRRVFSNQTIGLGS